MSNSEGEGIPNDTVYVFNTPNAAFPGDTVAITATDNLGNFVVDVDPLELTDIYGVSAWSCPDVISYQFNEFQDTVFVSLVCDGDSSNAPQEYLFIGGIPVDETGQTWSFISSAFGIVETYDWTIDGQSFNTEDVIYTFPEPGSYLVELTTLMASGSELYASMNVDVIDGGNTPGGGTLECQALFFPYPDSLGEGVVFVNSSSGTDLTYFWDFGDGNTSTDPYPTHVYDEFMEYEVCLTITGEDCSDTLCLVLTEDWDGNIFGSGIMEEGKPELNEAKSDGYTFSVVPFPGSVLSNGDDINVIETSVFPNPSTGNFFLQLFSNEEVTGTLRIHDLTGKRIFERIAHLSTGSNQFQIDLSEYPQGIYLMVFSGERSNAVQKLNLSK